MPGICGKSYKVILHFGPIQSELYTGYQLQENNYLSALHKIRSDYCIFVRYRVLTEASVKLRPVQNVI
jgi:hypothetical protein